MQQAPLKQITAAGTSEIAAGWVLMGRRPYLLNKTLRLCREHNDNYIFDLYNLQFQFSSAHLGRMLPLGLAGGAAMLGGPEADEDLSGLPRASLRSEQRLVGGFRAGEYGEYGPL